MREKLIRFMYGRNGVDTLSKHMMWGAVIACLLSNIPHLGILGPISMGMIAYSYFRIFSRNIPKRYAENIKYYNFVNKVKAGPKKWLNVLKQSKDYKIFKCPTCRQKLRVPRGRGNVEVRCRKCATVFRGRT